MINTGVSLGLFQDIPDWVVALAWLVVVISAVKVRELWERIALAAIVLGGGLNLWSRHMRGGVEDNWIFLGVLYNNAADYLIFFGVVLYGYTYFVRR